MRVAAFVTLLAAVPAVAAAQSQSAAEPIVQVGLYGYQADGSIGVAAWATAPDLTSTVYLSARCGFGAGNRQPPADATDVWQFTGKVLSATSEEAVLQLDWRRPMVQGRTVDGNQSSTQLTLRAGESVQLDQATIKEKPNCPASVAFEARYTRTRLLTAGTGSRAGGGRATARAGGAKVNVGRASGGGISFPAVPVGSVPRLFEVNLWLVHGVPGRADDVTHAVLSMNEAGASFAFPPVAIATTTGTAMVQVTGSFAVTQSENGEQQLVFSTNRHVTNSRAATATVGLPRDRPDTTQGGSRTTNPMPKPDEVLSFEMPAIRLNGEQAAPDRFSVRVKIAPR